MSTVMRIEGLKVMIWPNDHQPAHVHVMNRECEAVFNLNCPDGPPKLRGNYGFRGIDLTRIEAALAVFVTALCADWRQVHGH